MAKQIMDGCTAATYVAYALSDVATIFPISPVAEMGQIANKWAIKGIKNIFGQTLQVEELESELGAAGATHGALAAGALACTFTNSQGLMLMIPNMHKIAGELLPGVFHIGTRSVAAHALSIFGDHSDVMGCRSTGFAFLASSSVQETMDLALVAHLAAIEGSVPVLHFFDGWRTANEMATIDTIAYADMAPLVNMDKVKAIRKRGLNPINPQLRGSAQNPNVFFQNREACNPYYLAFPAIVQEQMDKVAKLTGRQYHLFDYYGAEDADTVIISIASSAQVTRSTVEYLNAHGYKVGAVNVRLYRPFCPDRLMEAIPSTVKNIAVLDRTKEAGASGEPLFLDVAAAVQASGHDIRVIGGRYGLSSKEFDPSMVLAVVKNAQAEKPIYGFTVGINDDVTHLSLDYSTHLSLAPSTLHQAIFYGIGADGTVGATKMAASIFGSSEDLYAQAFFSYSAKKSGGYTISQLRVSAEPINAEYSIEEADYVGCNKHTYVHTYPLVDNLRQGGTLVVNSPWTAADFDREFPAELKRKIAAKQVKLYNVDADSVARKTGMGVRINTIMLTAFFKLTSIIDFDKAQADLKQLITQMYMHEGGAVVNMNLAAVDAALSALTPIEYPADEWAKAVDTTPKPDLTHATPAYRFYERISKPCLSLRGNDIPVSYLTADGSMPMGTTAYEKRRIAINVPEWNVDNCIECAQCSFVCPHAAIRPVLLSAAERAAAPAELTSKPETFPALKDYQYRIQVYVEDCTGCGSCALICPGHALTMVPLASQMPLQPRLLDYCEKNISIKDNLLPRTTVVGTQLQQPLLQFSGACAGCGETPYVKLLTQLFGDRMIIANATGCSSIWGADYPSNAYCTNQRGQGPAWANSLFEDNAEYGYGMAVAVARRRDALADAAKRLVEVSGPVGEAAAAWLAARSNATLSRTTGDTLLAAIAKLPQPLSADEQFVVDNAEMLGKPSIWCVGGDGWAYDIGFAGLDHVLAQNIDINVLVLDTECYSNTGGQTSKATPLGAVAKYSEDGKRTNKKNLGLMMMSYGSIYVASIALGANFQSTIDTLIEAEAYDGPSIVIAYCPCLEHGIRAGLGHSILEERMAVATGYWNTYRFNPALAAQGKNPLTVTEVAPEITTAAGKDDFLRFINGEDRYVDLKMIDPAEAAILQPELLDHCDDIYAILAQQSQLQPPTPTHGA